MHIWKKRTPALVIHFVMCIAAPPRGPIFIVSPLLNLSIFTQFCPFFSIFTQFFPSPPAPKSKFLLVIGSPSFFHVWLHAFYRYEGSLHPLQGTFSFSTEEHEGSSFLSTVLSCETRYAARVPFGVSFYKSNGRFYYSFLSIFMICRDFFS